MRRRRSTTPTTCHCHCHLYYQRTLLLLLAITYITVTTTTLAQTPTCVDYTLTTFHNIVTYKYDATAVELGPNAAFTDLVYQPIRTLLSRLSPACLNATAKYIAASLFIRCNTAQTATLPPCRTLCTDQENACSQDEQLMLTQNIDPRPLMLTPCSGAETLCNDMQTDLPTPISTQDVSLLVDRCELYDPNAYPFFKTLFSTNHQLFVPAHTTQTMLQQQVKHLQLVLDGIPSPDCRQATAALIAGHKAMGCHYSTLPSGAPLPKQYLLPRLPCRTSVCIAFQQVCSVKEQFLVQTVYRNGAPLNCHTDTGNVVPGNPDWPNQFTNFTKPSDGIDHYAPCRDPTTPLAPIQHARCEPLPHTYTCAGIIDHDVYLAPNDRCLLDLENTVKDLLPAILPTMSTDCAKATSRMRCHQVFMQCDNSSIADALAQKASVTADSFPPIPFPRYPGKVLCQDVADKCPGVAQLHFYGKDASERKGKFINFTTDAGAVTLALQQQGLSVAMSVLTGVCNQSVVTASRGLSFNDFPQHEAYFGDVPDSAVPMKTPVNNGSSTISFAQTVVPLSTCQVFDSTTIRNLTRARWTAGTRSEDPIIDVPRSYCENVIDEGSSVYVPHPHTLGTLNEVARQYLTLQHALPTGGSFTQGNSCMAAFTAYVCSATFMPCSDIVIRDDIIVFPEYPTETPAVPYQYMVRQALPHFPCQSVCTNVHARCGSLLQGQVVCDARDLGPSDEAGMFTNTKFCNGSTESGGQLNAPVAGTFFLDYSGVAVTEGIPVPATLPVVSLRGETVCNAATGAISTPVSELGYTCPQPLHDLRTADKFGRYTLPDYENAIGGCALPCPAPLYAKDDYDMYKDVLLGLSIPSVLLLMYIFVSWYKFQPLRKKKKPFIFICATAMYSMSSFVGVVFEPERLICDGPSRATRLDSTFPGWYCTINALIINTFGIMAANAWFTIIFELFVRLVLEIRLTKESQHKVDMCLYAWIFLPSAFAAFFTFTEKTLGNIQGVPVCIFNTDWKLDVFITAPLSMDCILGTLAIIWVIHKIPRLSSKTAYYATLKFAIVSFFSLCGIYIYLMDVRIHSSDWERSMIKWTECLVQDKQLAIASGNVRFGCGELPDDTPSLIVLYLNVLAFLPGYFMFSIFANATYRYWVQTFTGASQIGTYGDKTVGNSTMSRPASSAVTSGSGSGAVKRVVVKRNVVAPAPVKEH